MAAAVKKCASPTQHGHAHDRAVRTWRVKQPAQTSFPHDNCTGQSRISLHSGQATAERAMVEERQ